MQWMASHHLSSKNLTSGEKLALMDALKEEIRRDNEEKKRESNKKFYGNRFTNQNIENVESTPIGVQSTKTRSETWTDSQTAQKAGVGVGTVARYNRVMNSDDETLKEQVKTGQVKIGTAYREVKKILTCNISRKC